jgi:phosphatidylinositol glycan class W
LIYYKLICPFFQVLSTIILRILPESLGKHPWIIGIFIGLCYERALINGLEDFVLNGSKGDGTRTIFIDANREGICSSFGYVALYFIGVSIGKLIFHNK